MEYKYEYKNTTHSMFQKFVQGEYYVNNFTVALPPRHHKTSMIMDFAHDTSIKNPDANIVVATFNRRAADNIHRKLRNAECRMDNIKCVGLGEGLSGYGADFIFIDDLEGQGNYACDWYRDTLYCRGKVDCKIFCIGSYFGKLNLFTYMDKEECVSLKIPAIGISKGEHNKLPTAKIALSLYDEESLLRILNTIGGEMFDVLYQHNYTLD